MTMPPAMTGPEIALFKRYLSKATVAFEWGCGGSTFLLNALSRFKSVESDLNFMKKVKPHVHGDMLWANIGLTGEYGYPVDRFKQDEWSIYPELFEKRFSDTDFVFIDGRFRVACALKVYMSGYDGIVLFHDFNRKEYQVILNYFDTIEQVDTLVVLKPKEPRVNVEDMYTIATYATG